MERQWNIYFRMSKSGSDSSACFAETFTDAVKCADGMVGMEYADDDICTIAYICDDNFCELTSDPFVGSQQANRE